MNSNTHKNFIDSGQKSGVTAHQVHNPPLNLNPSHHNIVPNANVPPASTGSMRPTSGGGALSNAGQMMMQSSNKKVNN